MLKITEVLPNPVGKDTGSEYVVLFNNSSVTVNVVGWRLQDASGKKSNINIGKLSPGAQFKVIGLDLKITLNNRQETIKLFDAGGGLVDSFSYTGPAAEGVPLLNTAQLTPEIKKLLFDEFVPRQPKTVEVGGQIFLVAICLALVLAGISVYIFRQVRKEEVKRKS